MTKSEADHSETEAGFMRRVVALYATEPDLHALPREVFDCVSVAARSEIVAYTEFHTGSGEFRAEFSRPDPDPERRARLAAAYMRHARSHPFWARDPVFFGERVLRESDFFSDAEYMALPIAQEAYLPSGAHRQMAFLVVNEGYALSVSAHRVVGEPAFSDTERDRMQELRGHVARLYRQALERTARTMPPVERLIHLCPDLTTRQRDVARWIAEGKSNESIAQLLGIRLDTVKSHLRIVYDKLGVDDRLAAALAIHRRPPFAKLPPMWTLPGARWSGDGLHTTD
ncbi:MAG: helix-turn-helix transcriptional regulator [Rhodanobacter denitrificans]|uniref:Helix-turn-helix transcriptional regulator n=1 Tax=Rhodanobacter denitrificans TaxID=666685 RepID=A0A2W5MBX3_9GAMM|nr:MAG: helix-turn-helix transcriptional regulator [Rhodanobacter denitrificans]